KLLTDLSKFGQVASHIITSSREQTVAGLRDLRPILAHLQAAGTNLPRSLELFPTYPFPRNIAGGVPGDYNGLKLTFNPDPMIRRGVKIQLVAFVVISLVGIVYVGLNYIGVNVTNHPYTVKLMLADTGGIFPNAAVTERGVDVGRVGSMRLTASHQVEVQLN